MSEYDDGGPAHPATIPTGIANLTTDHPGMSLRDWFAGQALASLSGDINPHLPESRASGAWPEPLELAERRAKWAYLQADAMLAAREK